MQHAISRAMELVREVTVFGTMLEDHYDMDRQELEDVMLPISRTCSIIIISAYVARGPKLPDLLDC